MRIAETMHHLHFDSYDGQGLQRRGFPPGPPWWARAARACSLAFIFALGPVSAGAAQAGSMTPVTRPLQTDAAGNPAHQPSDQDAMVQHAQLHMSERRNEDRQKALVADTNRLLELAEQLKLEVDKSSKDQLSIDVFKRAEQIEKLARSVKEKMRGN